ncbi:MAG: ferritin family protein [Terracidiphilus sp.]
MSERDILALVISLEEEDERINADYFEALRQDFPAFAAVFESMRKDEPDHRRRIIELYRRRLTSRCPYSPPRSKWILQEPAVARETTQ